MTTLSNDTKRCGYCKKEFSVLRPSLWAYKQKHIFFCSWKCMREKELAKDMKKVTREQKEKAVRIAIEGGNPVEFLGRCGSESPDKLWWYIKNKLKDANPELYAQIPDRREKSHDTPAPSVPAAGKVERPAAPMEERAPEPEEVKAEAPVKEEAKPAVSPVNADETAVAQSKEVPKPIGGGDWEPAVEEAPETAPEEIPAEAPKGEPEAEEQKPETIVAKAEPAEVPAEPPVRQKRKYTRHPKPENGEKPAAKEDRHKRKYTRHNAETVPAEELTEKPAVRRGRPPKGSRWNEIACQTTEVTAEQVESIKPSGMSSTSGNIINGYAVKNDIKVTKVKTAAGSFESVEDPNCIKWCPPGGTVSFDIEISGLKQLAEILPEALKVLGLE